MNQHDQPLLQPYEWRVSTSEDGKTFTRSQELYTLIGAAEECAKRNRAGGVWWITLETNGEAA